MRSEPLSLLSSPFRVRKVEDLLWAKLSRDPHAAASGGASRLQAEGHRFERSGTKRLVSQSGGALAIAQPWISFEDWNGPGGARPDLVFPELHIIVEFKLTMTRSAEEQLQDLYLPLCEEIWGQAPWRLIACSKRWLGEAKPLRGRLLEAAPGLNWMLLP